MLEFLQLVIGGVSIGCIYALVALGFVLIYKATEVVNFAQGELLMLGAFLAYTFISIFGWNYWVGAAAAIVCMFFVGNMVDRVVLRPVLGQPQFAIVMVTIGFGYVARSVAGMMPGWGTETYAIDTPFSGQGMQIIPESMGALVIAQTDLSVIVATILFCIVLYFFFTYTKLGVAMQASSQNQLASYYMGIPVKSVFSMIWGISAAVAAAAGILLAPTTLIDSNMGFIGLKAFPAAVLGGFGSIPGAVVGGILIGIIETLSGFYLPPGFKNVAAYVVLLVVLVVRPQGLFGEKTGKRV
ncbi:branched-chain amino acid ABC transporter permease [Sneathiella sp. P13V-1]|uniref:branched-chain amino acid ABC transporter permease n=1 Tax=Sneathiella sp. P13V-1 TaxID=2697366 RepID=UPI00187B9388|nr:branched-chain amino acid ABC transporter permease [Sneathiella sp. P13V-1]